MSTQIKNYETFKQVIEEELKTFLPKHFKEVAFSIQTVTKVNAVKDGVQIRVDSNNIGPIIYFDFLYEIYLGTEDITKVLDEILDIAKQSVPEPLKKMDIDLSRSGLSPKIVFGLLNTEVNKDFLRTHPHREWNDLSIAYRCVVDKNENGLSSFWITQEIAEQVGLQEHELYQLAIKNTPRILPANIDIGEMYVSNDIGVDGASAILYPGLLSELSKAYDDDLYLVPISRHLMSAIPKYRFILINEMVQRSKMEEDFLSSSVYIYKRETNEVSVYKKYKKDSLLLKEV